MPHILTSWKEIGQYLGKGVRTVQRWEREAGLPVRRQTEPTHRAVIAIPEELDAWARSRTRGPSGALAEALRREIASLHAENRELRARLDALEGTVAAMSTAELWSANDGHQPPAYFTAEEGRRVHDGDLAAVRQAQQSALEIRRSLDKPGYVPLNELEDLRILLGKLVLRIGQIAQAARPPTPP